MDGMHITLFGHNEKGFIGFIHGTNELVYLEKPSNWEKLVEEANLRYISPDDVKRINEEKKDESRTKRKPRNVKPKRGVSTSGSSNSGTGSKGRRKLQKK